MIGETYEKTGDLREAHRWLNLGLQRIGGAAADDDSADLDLVLLAIVRRRIRRALAVPPDAVDRLADLALPRRGEAAV